jgi:multiple sugar transport system substrate-binding protein
MAYRLIFALVLAVALHSGCGGPQHVKPVSGEEVVFWDRQTTETAQLLENIVADFNAQSAGLPVRVEKAGNYSDIYRKLTAGIQAGQLPALAAVYPGMVAEFVPSRSVVSLDEFMNDAERGLPPGDLDDFFPGVIESNRYPQFEHGFYSFPLAKSVLMLYFNSAVQAAAGIYHPPKTWDEFLDHCRVIKEKTGKFALALDIDASNMNGIIYSMGGELVDGRTTQYDQAPSLEAFRLIETLMEEELAFQIPPGTYQDEEMLARNEVAFTLRSSSGKTHVALLMEGDMERWGMVMIPQKDRTMPATVLYGPNVALFDVGEAQVDRAWEFVRYFTSAEVQVRWAVNTGYLPVRKSAADDPQMQRYWEEWKYNRTSFDALPYARPEPNLAGWQEVRPLIEAAITAVINGTKTGREAAVELKEKADIVLGMSARQD